MSQLRSELQEVFRQVFDDDSLAVTEATTAVDIDGWDSMAHINLIIAIEKQFAIKFSAAEIGGLSRRGQTIGNMIQLIQTKTGRGSA
jgi:acyl carrier protein